MDTTSRYLVFAGAGYLLTDELLTHEGLMCRLLGGEWDDKQGVIWEVVKPGKDGSSGIIEDVTDAIAEWVAKALFNEAGGPAEPSFGLREWIEAYAEDAASKYLKPNVYEPAGREYDGAYEGAA